MYTKDSFNKILGALMGVAVGDALGCTLEFIPAHSAHKKHTEIIGGGSFRWKKGQVTDDTDMTLCVARGILNNPSDPIMSIGNEFVKWANTSPIDVGNTCAISIQNYIRDKSWKHAAYNAHVMLDCKSAGNGSLMRCIPVALYYNTYAKMIEYTIAQSRLTHYSSIATECCILYNGVIELILNGNTPKYILKEYVNMAPISKNILQMTKEQLNPTGYSVDSLKCALWCFINTDSFEDAVTEAVNLCGDADTIGAITGGLAGAYYGYNNIPERWRNSILIKDEITDIAYQFVE